MSCYPQHRPVYCYVVWGQGKGPGGFPLPFVVGPFKTKQGAINAFKTDMPEPLPEGISWRVQQLVPYYTASGHLASLHFEQFIDPKVIIRAPSKPKDTDEPVAGEDNLDEEGEGDGAAA